MRVLGNKWVQLVTALLLSFGLSSMVHAQVGISDDTKQIAAVVRLAPSDLPVAGKATTISFDVKLQALLPTLNEVAVTVINVVDKTTNAVQVTVNGGVVSGDYTFKEAGTYELRLIVAAGDKMYVFRHNQNVVAATTAAVKPRTSPTIRSIGWLLVVIAVIVSVAAVALRRRLSKG